MKGTFLHGPTYHASHLGSCSRETYPIEESREPARKRKLSRLKICTPHCTGVEKERGEKDDSKLSLQVVANLGISGVKAGAAGDLVFVRAVKEDMRNSGVGMQTEVRRVVLPLTALDLLQSIRMHEKAALVAVC